MRSIEIIGNNYFGRWDEERTACRCIVVKDGMMLLSYERKTDQWMIPGGGLEDDETERECCIRELAEETGYIIEPSECMLEINEYYENFRFVSKYFFGTVKGECEITLTDREREVGMTPKWISVDEIAEIFSQHEKYSDTDEMRRGMYLREYTALSNLIK